MDKIVSVVIPTYDNKKQTDNAVESIVASSPNLVEIIVVDDYGKETYIYDEPLNSNCVSVRVIRLSSNVGPGLARKSGVEVASGKLIAFLDSDDTYSSGWVDELINAFDVQNELTKDCFVIVGSVVGGTPFHRLVWLLLESTPEKFQLLTARMVTIIFNPFYTPSIAASTPLCKFSDKLRYSEDYYTFAAMIFAAKKIVVSPSLSCTLGHVPNKMAGLTTDRREMFIGEILARFEIFFLDFVPLFYKSLIPIGVVYQLLRTMIKSFVNNIFIDKYKRKVLLIRKFSKIFFMGFKPSSLVGRYKGPRVIINSIPKSGTNLLLEILHKFPYLRGKVMRTIVTEQGIDILSYKIKKIRKGQCCPAHISYDASLEQSLKLNNVKMIFLVRDFRDTIVSHIDYIEKIDVGHKFNKFFNCAQSIDEKLDICLYGIPHVHSAWPSLVDDYKGWLSAENVLMVRFEDLINESKGIQEEVILRMSCFLGISKIDVTKIINGMFDKNGVTYNNPSVGKWKTYFNEKQAKKMNNVLKESLVSFGYEL